MRILSSASRASMSSSRSTSDCLGLAGGTRGYRNIADQITHLQPGSSGVLGWTCSDLSGRPDAQVAGVYETP